MVMELSGFAPAPCWQVCGQVGGHANCSNPWRGGMTELVCCARVTFDVASLPLGIHPHQLRRHVAGMFTAWCTASPWDATEPLTKAVEPCVQ